MRQRERILATAAKLFDAKGYHETSVDDIAKAAGLTKGGLYYHVVSKEDLLFQIQDDLLDRLILGLKRALAGKKTATEKLSVLIRAYLNQLHANRARIAVVFYGEKVTVAADKAEQIRRKRRSYIGFVRQIVQEGVENGEFRQDLDPQVAAFGVLGMCFWTFLWYRPDGRVSADKIADNYAEMAIAVLRRPAIAHPSDD